MNTRKILSAIGTFAVVGAVSTAGAALWTKVLNGTAQTDTPEVRQNHIRRLQEGKEGPLTQRLFFFFIRTKGRLLYGRRSFCI